MMAAARARRRWPWTSPTTCGIEGGRVMKRSEAAGPALARGVLDPLGRRALREPPAVRQVPGADQPRHVRGQPVDPGPDAGSRASRSTRVASRGAWPARSRWAGVKLFRYPGPDDPCILVRTAPRRSSWPTARSAPTSPARCTTRRKRGRLECPCHEGYFSVRDGRVLQGPPPRPLPRIVIERQGDRLIAMGVDLQTDFQKERRA